VEFSERFDLKGTDATSIAGVRPERFFASERRGIDEVPRSAFSAAGALGSESAIERSTSGVNHGWWHACESMIGKDSAPAAAKAAGALALG
jgi:hypothetical protein